MHDLQALVHAARQATWTASAYGATAVRVAMRGHGLQHVHAALAREDRLVFVVGSPRSGTSFLGASLGSQPDWVDLGEVPLLKAQVPELAVLPLDEQVRRVRRILERVRVLGLARGLRGVEQNPETTYVLGAALIAYPRSRAVHIVRDGRDVVCSLLERGWFDPRRAGLDDARRAYGAYPRFWVEPERRDEFERVSESRRAAWAWRRYVTTARAHHERTVELRYESLVRDPDAAAGELAEALDGAEGPLRAALSQARDSSVGRWRRELTRQQLADVEAEAGPLLAELGYA